MPISHPKIIEREIPIGHPKMGKSQTSTEIKQRIRPQSVFSFGGDKQET